MIIGLAILVAISMAFFLTLNYIIDQIDCSDPTKFDEGFLKMYGQEQAVVKCNESVSVGKMLIYTILGMPIIGITLLLSATKKKNII